MHRQRTLLKTAKECGTHSLGVANKNNQEQRGCVTSQERDTQNAKRLVKVLKVGSEVAGGIEYPR